MRAKIFFVVAILLVLGGGCNDVPKDQQVDYEKDVKPLVEESADKSFVRGSCNTIATASHCLDYRGSLWTEEQMKLNCGNAGIFSKDGCPYSDNGGCMAGGGTIAETVMWSYNEGANPIDSETLPYEIGACNALAVAKWVKPEDLLKK